MGVLTSSRTKLRVDDLYRGICAIQNAWIDLLDPGDSWLSPWLFMEPERQDYENIEVVSGPQFQRGSVCLKGHVKTGPSGFPGWIDLVQV